MLINAYVKLSYQQYTLSFYNSNSNLVLSNTSLKSFLFLNTLNWLIFFFVYYRVLSCTLSCSSSFFYYNDDQPDENVKMRFKQIFKHENPGKFIVKERIL